jgi:hypothetical protein
LPLVSHVFFSELFKLNPLAQEHSAQWLSRFELSDSLKLADFASAITTADASELQGVLEASDPEVRWGCSHGAAATTTAALVLTLAHSPFPRPPPPLAAPRSA